MECLLAFSFFKAFLQALKSLSGMPPDCAFGTFVGLLDTTLGGLTLGGFTTLASGTSGVLNRAATFLEVSIAIGVVDALRLGFSGCGLDGNRSLVGGLREICGLRGGPPDFIDRVGLIGTLTAGI